MHLTSCVPPHLEVDSLQNPHLSLMWISFKPKPFLTSRYLSCLMVVPSDELISWHGYNSRVGTKLHLTSLHFFRSNVNQVTLIISVISISKFSDTRKMLQIINKPSKNICFIELAMQFLPDLKMSIWVQWNERGNWKPISWTENGNGFSPRSAICTEIASAFLFYLMLSNGFHAMKNSKHSLVW